MAVGNRVLAAIAAVVILAGSAVMVTAAPAGATTATITVTSSADGLGTCPSANSCTLRQAILNSNAVGPNESDDVTISITPGLAAISLVTGLSYSGGLGNSHSLSIDGNGVTITTTNPIQLFNAATTGLVTITETKWTKAYHAYAGGAIYSAGPLTITDSTFSENLSAQYGGAVFAAQALVMERVEFSDNVSGQDGGAFWAWMTAEITDAVFTDNRTLGSGGAGAVSHNAALTRVEATGNSSDSHAGAFSFQSTAQISDSFFFDNEGTDFGGAVRALGTLSVSDSLFSLNHAIGIPGSGGAIAALTVTIENSEFDLNSALGYGGAVHSVQNLTVDQSDFAGNTARGVGGAIATGSGFSVTDSSFSDNDSGTQGAALYGDAGTSTLLNSTVEGNTAGVSGAVASSGILNVAASTIVGNSVTTPGPAPILDAGSLSLFGNVLDSDDASNPLCNGAITSLGYNYANDTSCGLTATGDSQRLTNDPMLSELGDFGGETMTMMPLIGSPLLGAIPNAACLTGPASGAVTDQRGLPRPNFAGGPCDIGAVQSGPLMLVTMFGPKIEVSVAKFASTVTVTIYSTPTVLGSISVNTQGSGTSSFDLPCDIGLGAHTITATASGGQISSVDVAISECLPSGPSPDPSPDPVVPVFAG